MSWLRTAGLTLGAVVLFIATVAATRPPDLQRGNVRAQRIVATPIPTPSPVPTPVPQLQDGPPVCRGLSNPGGGLSWAPSRDAGPWPTNGSVELPSLGVAAPIVRVGVDMKSAMVVPGNARDVAWLDQGVFPGNTQNAVLAGHINYNRRAGSFSNIQRMSEGDPVVVVMDGKRWTFKVTWVCSFDRDTDLAEQIMGYTERPSVTLISCGGVFDRRARTHTNRIAVRAELVEAVEV